MKREVIRINSQEDWDKLPSYIENKEIVIKQDLTFRMNKSLTGCDVVIRRESNLVVWNK